MNVGKNWRRCKKCDKIKLITEFAFANKKLNKRHYRCKECTKKYRLDNIDKIREYNRKYYSEHYIEISRKRWERNYRIRQREKNLFGKFKEFNIKVRLIALIFNQSVEGKAVFLNFNDARSLPLSIENNRVTRWMSWLK